VISREDSGADNDDSPEVADIGACWPWDQEIAEFFEEFGRIIGIEMGHGIEPAQAGPPQCGRINEGSGRVGGLPAAAIDAVGVAGEGGNPRRAIEGDCQRQRRIPDWAAASVAANRPSIRRRR
jgi:hypothetical protein